MNLERHRPESRLHRCLRNAAASGGALDWLAVFAIGAWFGFLLSGAL